MPTNADCTFCDGARSPTRSEIAWPQLPAICAADTWSDSAVCPYQSLQLSAIRVRGNDPFEGSAVFCGSFFSASLIAAFLLRCLQVRRTVGPAGPSDASAAAWPSGPRLASGLGHGENVGAPTAAPFATTCRASRPCRVPPRSGSLRDEPSPLSYPRRRASASR